MATLVLTSAASAYAGSAGLGFMASTALAVGAGLVGGVIDQALFGGGGRGRQAEGPRIDELQLQTSSEGAPIPRIYGRARLSGQLIWASKFKEVVSTRTTQSSSGGGGGGKGFGGGGASGGGSTVTEYSYFARFAVGLCEGEITRVGRIWADGKLLDLSSVNFRVYRGTELQLPDPMIEEIEGAGSAPAFRGLAYVVFEDLPLAEFGNRVPQLSFEVFRGLSDVEGLIRGVDLIPGSTEFGYDPQVQIKDLGSGRTGPENQNNNSGFSDWELALDQLADSCPDCRSVALVVSWFGSDLRAGHCQIRPAVETYNKITAPDAWSVSGMVRGTAYLVSQSGSSPAFGGTPSDSSVIRAIQDLNARGYRVLFYPFLMMDIAAANSLPDPYSGATGQPEYPWRGRITCDPAPGEAGSPDNSAAVTTQIDALFGSAATTDFMPSGTAVSYTGAAEWSLRRMILHYAHLCALAGGVDAFLVGSELRGLTQLRAGGGSYPTVARLKTLVADVRAVLPAAKISYAADWSEYFGHHPDDGSGDVYFHLDPFWADVNVNFIGIDNYMPLSDWRDGDAHLDAAQAPAIYDLGYLKGNIRAGEGFNWYYANESDRQSQTRTPITDSAYGKDWVFRYKDLWGWWENTHFNRPGGVESAIATEWVPQSKPFWFTEIGCPAVDKGTNEPNRFIDVKSSESGAPHFSSGRPDDLIQRRYLQAMYQFWDPANPEYAVGSNPVSTVYGGPMVDPDNLHVWSWDARPWPDFPARGSLWADAENWRLGHWVNGRLGAVPLRELVERLLTDYGFADFDATALVGVVDGIVIDRIMSARDVLQPLAQAFFFDPSEEGMMIHFRHRSGAQTISLTTDTIVAVERGGESDVEMTRSQETELPLSLKLQYIDGNADYRRGSAESRRLAGNSARVASMNLPLVMGQSDAQRIADSLLQEIWAGRERLRLSLPPSQLAASPGDIIDWQANGSSQKFRIESIEDGAGRPVEAMRVESAIYQQLTGPERAIAVPPPAAFGPPLTEFLDLPLLSGTETPHAVRVAAFANPWPGGVAIYRSPSTTGYVWDSLADAPAVIGESDADFSAGPVGRWDRGNALFVSLYGGMLQSQDDLAVLAGANIAAIRNGAGAWEVFQFAEAELIGPNQYKLSRLLRGQAGTEQAMASPVLAGARFVLLDGAVMQSGMSAEQRGLPLNWRVGPAGRPIDDFTYQTMAYTPQGMGLRPLSPVHVRALRDASNHDLTISWVRRTRIGGDSWAQTEVPLSEVSEVYEVDIRDGQQTVRTLQSNVPQIVYTAAQQNADFTGGAPVTPLSIAIYQISESYGRGSAREVTLYV